MKRRLQATLLAGLTACAAADAPPPAPFGPSAELTARTNPGAVPAVYVNGLWYEADEDGVRFVPGERYQAGGTFVAERPEDAEVIDLAGAYVIPPFGEAHNHNLDGPWSMERGADYLADGVFYMKNANSVLSVDAWATPLWEGPETVDIAWAHAGLSTSGSHPEPLYRRLAERYRLDPDALEGEAFWDMSDVETLEARWPRVLAADPDLVKLYLLDLAGEEGEPEGLTRPVAARAAALAHEARLPVTVHVDTASDWRTAMQLGADEAAHMPPQFLDEDTEDAHYELTPAMAAEAAERGFVTVTTTLIATQYLDENDPQLGRIRAVQAENIRLLHEAGAPLAFGSDVYDANGLDEAMNVASLDVMSDEALLRIAVETPRRSVFPDRAIGTLSPGWEASFVALACDPSADFEGCARRPRVLVKQGTAIDVQSEE